eukprot:SM005584S18201  [mRNA]  locus=s5584:3:953:- [translate_table: standard]
MAQLGAAARLAALLVAVLALGLAGQARAQCAGTDNCKSGGDQTAMYACIGNMDSCICGPMYYFPSGSVGAFLGCLRQQCFMDSCLTNATNCCAFGGDTGATCMDEKANSGGSVNTMYSCNCSAGFTQVGDATQNTATCVPGSAVAPAPAPSSPPPPLTTASPP